MCEKAASVKTTLRIPGQWSHPRELLERLPADFQVTSDRLITPDGAEIEIFPARPDDQFAEIFKTSCRRPANPDEIEAVCSYTVNIVLSGPGGSMDAATTMMGAGAAILRGGGAGVFIDNSALAHGGQHWIEMAEDSGPDALSFGYVGIAGRRGTARTMGMHVLGLPEIEMRLPNDDGDAIVQIIRYLCTSDKPIGDGHVLIGEDGLQYQVISKESDKSDLGSPMYNPWGRLKLVSMQDIADSN